MSINFNLQTAEKLQHESVLAPKVRAPVVAEGTGKPDPGKAVTDQAATCQATSRTRVASPTRYGGGGVSCVDLAGSEEIASSTGVRLHRLVHGLGRAGVLDGSRNRRRFLHAHIDPTCEFLGGWTASEPPGNPSAPPTSNIPLPRPPGSDSPPPSDGDQYLLTGRKYCPRPRLG